MLKACAKAELDDSLGVYYGKSGKGSFNMAFVRDGAKLNGDVPVSNTNTCTLKVCLVFRKGI